MIQLLCFHPLRRRSVPPRSAAPPALSRLLVRRGLTLVEMLISMAITLVMMAAVVNLFANISASVRDRRAMLELGSQLRSAREQLTRDLANATCPALTWQQPGEDNGYIEIIEGVRSDAAPLHPDLDSALDADGNSANGVQLGDATLVPSSQFSVDDGVTLGIAPLGPDDGMGLGDYDDILCLTVRNETEPYTGIGPDGNRVESEIAEVIWFATREFDEEIPGTDPAMRRIYRRALVVAPWLDPIDPTALNPPLELPADLSNMSADEYTYLVAQFYQRFDISVRWDPGSLRFIPNTLGDLTKRENRYYRSVFPVSFPFPMFTQVLAYPSEPAGQQYEVAPTPLRGERRGQDLMLNDALAFDVRVYDPGAPLLQTATGVFQPGDPGWVVATTQTGAAATSFGAFVDLGWAIKALNDGASYTYPAARPFPLFYDSRKLVPFDTPPTTGLAKSVFSAWEAGVWTYDAFPATYDTWSYHYEVDGLDQDNRDNDLHANGSYSGMATGADEGSNGFDDPTVPGDPTTMINGVDDPTERETAPPYDVPLRGIEVKLRVYEREARQVREATAVRSFVP
ncbi:MAG: hypothetical protein CMJ58_14705 [Planctomycetaceae bacterium]|nr:hypothetical protein [Planctomycetaceae bacterium]